MSSETSPEGAVVTDFPARIIDSSIAGAAIGLLATMQSRSLTLGQACGWGATGGCIAASLYTGFNFALWKVAGYTHPLHSTLAGAAAGYMLGLPRGSKFGLITAFAMGSTTTMVSQLDISIGRRIMAIVTQDEPIIEFVMEPKDAEPAIKVSTISERQRFRNRIFHEIIEKGPPEEQTKDEPRASEKASSIAPWLPIRIQKSPDAEDKGSTKPG